MLQFTSEIFFAEEEEEEVLIDIMRLGSMEGRVSCSYCTEDGSGKAGSRYQASSGEVVFEEGELNKTIRIRIINSEDWAATLEFKVKLFNPDFCELGKSLRVCRVKVIDQDTFPTSTYRKEVAGNMEMIGSLGVFRLLTEFCKWNYKQGSTARKTLVYLLLDQTKNLYLLYKLWAMAYLLNEVFKGLDKDPDFTIDQRTEQAIMIGVGWIVPMALVHLWDHLRERMDMLGHSAANIEKSAMRKYLNYNIDSQGRVDVAKLSSVLSVSSHSAAKGYMAVLYLAEKAGKIAIIIAFIWHKDPDALKFVGCMTVLLILWVWFRSATLSNALRRPLSLSRELSEEVVDIVTNYRLIACYQQRPKINDIFADKVEKLRVAKLEPASVRLHNEYFIRWLDPFFRGLYIILYARAVLDGDIGTGTFVATLNAFGEVTHSFAEGYEELMNIVTDALAMQKLTQFLNRATDVREHMKVNRERGQATKEAREKICRTETAHPYPTDLLDIRLKKVGFSYEADSQGYPDYGSGFHFRDLDLSVAQGSIVAVVGDHGNGRHTFMKLLGEELFPTDGCVFVPSHLRILFVTQEPCLLNSLSIWENICFGLAREKGTHDILIQRAQTILQLLDAKKLAALLDEEGELSSEETRHSVAEAVCCARAPENDVAYHHGNLPWCKTLSYTDKAKLHLARAFMMNPEVMVLQRPLLHFNFADQTQFAALIHKHVDQRGIGMTDDVETRRPRTVFVSLEGESQVDVVKGDLIWDLVPSEYRFRNTVRQITAPNNTGTSRMSFAVAESWLRKENGSDQESPRGDVALQRRDF